MTAEEREAYLAIPVTGSRRVWRESMSGRQSPPPRPGGPLRRKLLAALPWYVILILMLVALGAFLSGASDPDPAHKAAFIGGGCAALLFAGWIIVARLAQSRGDDG